MNQYETLVRVHTLEPPEMVQMDLRPGETQEGAQKRVDEAIEGVTCPTRVAEIIAEQRQQADWAVVIAQSC